MELDKLDTVETRHMILAKALFEEGEYKDAIILFRKVLVNQRNNFEAQLLMAKAMVLSKLYSFEDINSEFEKAYAINAPDSKAPYQNFLEEVNQISHSERALEVLCELGMANKKQYESLLERFKLKWTDDYHTLIADLDNKRISKLGLRELFFQALDTILDGLINKTDADEFNQALSKIQSMYSGEVTRKELLFEKTTHLLSSRLNKTRQALSLVNGELDKLTRRFRISEQTLYTLQETLKGEKHNFRIQQDILDQQKRKRDNWLYTTIGVLCLALILTVALSFRSGYTPTSSLDKFVSTDWAHEANLLKRDIQFSNPFQLYYDGIVNTGMLEKGARPSVSDTAFTHLINSVNVKPTDSVRQMIYIARMYDFLKKRQFKKAIHEGKTISDQTLSSENIVQKNWILGEAYSLSGKERAATEYYLKAKSGNSSVKVMDLRNKKVQRVAVAVGDRISLPNSPKDDNSYVTNNNFSIKICLQNAALHPPRKMATRAKGRLVKAGFEAGKISLMNLKPPLRRPVNKVYAYYRKQDQKNAVLTILSTLYPNVPKNFRDITQVSRARHRSVPEFFSKNDCDILIRMPNPYKPTDR